MEKRIRFGSIRLAACILLASMSAGRIQAQNGFNAIVYSSSGGSIVTSPSYALVDATRFSGSDICAMISSVFALYNQVNTPYLEGVVIDARGVSTAASCGSNPWSTLSGSNGPFSSVVLLPSGTITIQSTWILPDKTRLVGEGPSSTTIAAGSSLTTGDMIDMGAPSGFSCSARPDCPGIIIEHLGLVGNGNVNGIVNCCAQELSHVNDVSISNVKTGLWISDKYAENSGPYTNLTISGASVACLSIGPGVTATIPVTRGIHGLSCSVNNSSTAAITIDGSNNSLEDISISGSSSQDGILIGSHAPAQGNVLFNIQGTGLKNVIHISPNTTPTSGASNCPEFITTTNYNYVCDVTMLGVARSGGTTTIQDDLASPSQGINDSTVAIYVLGETIQNLSGTTTTDIGYSRFTTATASGNTPTWIVGPAAPSGTCAVGAIYSCTGSSGACTSGTSTGAVWQCLGGGTWKKIQ
jgi:hypothetical protein